MKRAPFVSVRVNYYYIQCHFFYQKFGTKKFHIDNAFNRIIKTIDFTKIYKM